MIKSTLVKSMSPEYAAVWTEWLLLCCIGYRGSSSKQWCFLAHFLPEICACDSRPLKCYHSLMFMVQTGVNNESQCTYSRHDSNKRSAESKVRPEETQSLFASREKQVVSESTQKVTRLVRKVFGLPRNWSPSFSVLLSILSGKRYHLAKEISHAIF